MREKLTKDAAPMALSADVGSPTLGGVVRDYYGDAAFGGELHQAAHQHGCGRIVIAVDPAHQRQERIKNENVGVYMVQLGVQCVPAALVNSRCAPH